jgi:hypothetical protein
VTTDGDTSIRNLRLFLASPGGVEAERAAVRRVVDEINVPFRRHGWQIEVLGWEDRGPASGRAQAEINQDVDRCHVFLGIVWDRWGTPTGEHSSGFEEEWERARKRWEADGSPELWLCFKDIEGEGREGEDADQPAQVTRFRQSIEVDEVAFHKPFRSPAEFQLAIRRELIGQLLDRSGLAAEAVGSIEVDWAGALEHEPIALLAQGQERERLAEELTASDPDRSATVFGELAKELEELGFAALSETYRKRAAGALVAAGRHEEALALRRAILLGSLDSTSPIDFEFDARGLGEILGPEHQWEAAAWSACVEWPLRRDDSIAALREALRNSDSARLDPAIVRIWRRTLWELWIEAGNTQGLCEEADGLKDSRAVNDDDELALLLAQALSTEARPDANGHWLALRDRALTLAEFDPGRAARLRACLAMKAACDGNWAEAEEGFISAAGLAARNAGSEEESAECFFSAQAISRLRGEILSIKGWGWRPMAASLRSARETAMSKGRRYEQGAMAAQLDGESSTAVRELLLGRALHRRAGHLRATMASTRSLAQVHDQSGNFVEACIAYCECGDGEGAKKAALKAAQDRELTTRLPLRGRDWEDRAVCSVLSEVGRCTSPARATALLPVVLEMTHRPTEATGTATTGVKALAELSVALRGEHLREAAERFVALVGEQHYGLSQAAGEGLRMLVELERVEGAEALVIQFARSPRTSAVSPGWVSRHLDTPMAFAAVRDGALEGQSQALMALALAGLVRGDAQLEEACRAHAEHLAKADIGHGPDKSILAWITFEGSGEIAALCSDRDLRRTVADKLLLYALESHWPRINRISALNGLKPLAISLDPLHYVAAIRPLAEPKEDLDLQSPFPPDVNSATPGELEASAIALAVELSERLPSWLGEVVVAARTDMRAAMRAASWSCAANSEEIEIEGAIEMALIDPEVSVQMAALHCWRRRRPTEPPPTAVLDRLVEAPYVAFRGLAIAVFEQYGIGADDARVVALLNDPDSYNARWAALRLDG